jgi:hypothetical protein
MPTIRIHVIEATSLLAADLDSKKFSLDFTVHAFTS